MKNFTAIFLLCFTTHILFSQNQQLWGTTSGGGTFGDGALFKADMDGSNVKNGYSFDTGNHMLYATGEICEASNGKIYGLAGIPGIGFESIVYEYDPATNVYKKKVQIPEIDGREPRGQMIEAPNGKLYGTSSHGGAYNSGVLFEYDFQNNIYTKKYDFGIPGVTDQTYCGMTLASNGKLYGTTRTGGTWNLGGVVYEFDPITGVFTVVHNFTTIAGGMQPFAPPVEAPNGKLYGTTRSGGTGGDNGTIYEYDPGSGAFAKVYDFPAGANFGYPDFLVAAANGKIYGSCNGGVTLLNGMIFEFDPDTYAFTIVHEFPGGDSGEHPFGKITQALNGKLYGFCGTSMIASPTLMYEYDYVTDSYQVFAQLDPQVSGYGDFLWENVEMDQLSNGDFYFVFSDGGPFDNGAVSKVNSVTGEVSMVLSNNQIDYNGENHGDSPKGGLIQATNDKLYGTTHSGGDNLFGVFFQYDPLIDDYIKRIDFDGPNYGSHPTGGILQASDNLIYITTTMGGLGDLGTLVAYDLVTATATKKHDFDGLATGAEPIGGLMQASNGLIYGLAAGGGANGMGTLYEYDPVTGICTKKHDFDGAATGNFPYGKLVEATNGKLYGMTNSGGANGQGIIFEYDPVSGALVNLFDFDGTLTGGHPWGSLVEGASGKLYGMTYQGGVNTIGAFFEYDYTTDTFTKLLDFDGPGNGYAPYGDLLKTDGGNLVGLTNLGGANDRGVLFHYDVTSSTFTVKHHFDETDKGAYPFGGLIAVDTCFGGYATADSATIYPGMNYVFPDGTIMTDITAPVVYTSMLVAQNGCDSVVTTYIQMGIPLMGNVFTFPVTVIDSCDATAIAMIEGGVPPYHYDWFTQLHNEDLQIIDSLCNGTHTLKVTDNIGDELFVDYYITDSVDYYVWYDTTDIIPTDTIFMVAVNCLLDYSLPLDSAFITQFYYMYPDSIPPGDLHFIEYTYYQAGVAYIHQDTISMETGNYYLLDFSVYCPSKSVNSIKIVLTGFGFPDILSIADFTKRQAILLYPNPATEKLFISVPDALTDACIEVLDMSGRMVLQRTHQTGAAFELPLTDLSAGTYLLRIQSDQFTTTTLFQKN